MSELVYSRHGGELVLAEFAADERSVTVALKDFDPRLRLTWEIDSQSGRQVWNVHYVWSQDHPARLVLTWRENGAGAPLPLTMRIVEEVKRLREVDTGRAVDDANVKLREQVDKDAFDDTLSVTTDFQRLYRTGRIHVPLRPKHFGRDAA